MDVRLLLSERPYLFYYMCYRRDVVRAVGVSLGWNITTRIGARDIWVDTWLEGCVVKNIILRNAGVYLLLRIMVCEHGS